MLSDQAIQVLREINPWWTDSRTVRPVPPDYTRPMILDLASRFRRRRGLIEVIRGPRQVGKTTGIYQIIRAFLREGIRGTDILLVRFDLAVIRDEPTTLREIVSWFAETVRGHPIESGPPAYVFLDEVHKVRRWDEEVKHLTETYPIRMLLTGSSSVLVAQGGRESLAGRVFTTELPTFSFREVLECWRPGIAAALPPRIRFLATIDGDLQRSCEAIAALRPQQHLAIHRALERYYMRGGYPRLYTGEVEDDRWADYLEKTVFESVLGADIPDLYPVQNPALLRYVYLSVARLTAQELAQNKIAAMATAAGIPANQPTVGTYLRYLADALLVREFRRHPLARAASPKTPSKFTVNDLGIRNAILRGAPSLWESDPAALGPLVETLVQAAIRDHGLAVHFWRDRKDPRDRRSPVLEVDFVAERSDGTAIPIEVKFKRRIDAEDTAGVRHFLGQFDSPVGIIVTRSLLRWDPANRVLCVPLAHFLAAY